MVCCPHRGSTPLVREILDPPLSTHVYERLYGLCGVCIFHLTEVRQVQRSAAVLPVRQVRACAMLQQDLKK